jgi:hypothetical protein
MSKFPSSCYVSGVFLGVYPEQIVSTDFSKQQFAIDTEEQFNNIKVFEATRTVNSDTIAQLRDFKRGDLVKVSFNVRSNKTAEGKWFTNVTAWKISRYVSQDTDDFQNPDPAALTVHTPSSDPIGDGDDLPF